VKNLPTVDGTQEQRGERGFPAVAGLGLDWTGFPADKRPSRPSVVCGQPLVKIPSRWAPGLDPVAMGPTGGASPLSSLSGESELGRWRCVVRPRRGAGRGDRVWQGTTLEGTRGLADIWLQFAPLLGARMRLTRVRGAGCTPRRHIASLPRSRLLGGSAASCEAGGVGVDGEGGSARGPARVPRRVPGDSGGAEGRREGRLRSRWGKEMDSLVNVFHRADWKTFSSWRRGVDGGYRHPG
jgi:hypothetical protein